MAKAELPAPSPFLLEWRARLLEAASLGAVADLACGRGRHARACASWGLRPVALDRSADALRDLVIASPACRTVRCDLEAGHKIPLKSGSCGVILVFRFLFRPLAPAIEAALAPGGLLLYETFSVRQREHSAHPSNPAFLLAEGELPTLFGGLEVLEHVEGTDLGTRPYAYGRLAARRRL